MYRVWWNQLTWGNPEYLLKIILAAKQLWLVESVAWSCEVRTQFSATIKILHLTRRQDLLTTLGKTRHLDFCIYNRHQLPSLDKVLALTQVHQEKRDTCTAKLALLIGETVPKIIRTANYSCRLYRGKKLFYPIWYYTRPLILYANKKPEIIISIRLQL